MSSGTDDGWGMMAAGGGQRCYGVFTILKINPPIPQAVPVSSGELWINACSSGVVDHVAVLQRHGFWLLASFRNLTFPGPKVSTVRFAGIDVGPTATLAVLQYIIEYSSTGRGYRGLRDQDPLGILLSIRGSDIRPTYLLTLPTDFSRALLPTAAFLTKANPQATSFHIYTTLTFHLSAKLQTLEADRLIAF